MQDILPHNTKDLIELYQKVLDIKNEADRIFRPVLDEIFKAIKYPSLGSFRSNLLKSMDYPYPIKKLIDDSSIHITNHNINGNRFMIAKVNLLSEDNMGTIVKLKMEHITINLAINTNIFNNKNDNQVLGQFAWKNADSLINALCKHYDSKQAKELEEYLELIERLQNDIYQRLQKIYYQIEGE